MNDVVITKPMMGIFGMQVCAKKGTSDESILSVCNTENPAGTQNGWCRVFRHVDEGDTLLGENCLPVQCKDHEDREHLIIIC